MMSTFAGNVAEGFKRCTCCAAIFASFFFGTTATYAADATSVSTGALDAARAAVSATVLAPMSPQLGPSLILDVVVTNGDVTIFLSNDLLGLSDVGSAEFETYLHALHTAISTTLLGYRTDLTFKTVIGTKSLPELHSALMTPKEMAVIPDEVATLGVSGKRVVLSPGHGYYWTGSSWILQRDSYWGIVEDLVNSDFAIMTSSRLSSLGADVRPARNLSKTAGTGESGNPKWQEAARYHLKAIGVPSSIWNESGYTSQRDQDIRCRPNYANYLAANLLVSIHNNASGSSGPASGTETWYDSTHGQPSESSRLATILQARVVNAIRSQYDSSWVSRGVKASDGGYGEIRLATCPAVIIEIAFFDKQSPDNLALQSESFKTIVANAIADGIDEFFMVDQPAITSPVPGSTLTSSSATFQWSSATGVTEYFLYVGRSLGGNDLYAQNVGMNRSVAVTGLPTDGSTLYVRLYWNTAAGWQYADYTYTAYYSVATYAVGYSPNGATSGTAPESQTKTHGVTLTLRTNSGNLAKTGYTFAGWNTIANGSGVDYAAGGSYTANASATLYAKWTASTQPAITSPVPGSTLTASSATFQWSSGTGVTEYFLYVGRSLGGNDLYAQNVGMNRSVAVTGLPTDGSTLYVRLYWNASAGWQHADYTYTAYYSGAGPVGYRPYGYLYFTWPYAYDATLGDWIYFNQNDQQWVYGYPPASSGWRDLNESGLAAGWSWHHWPYAYDLEGSSWYYMNAGVQWTLNLRTGQWTMFGQ